MQPRKPLESVLQGVSKWFPCQKKRAPPRWGVRWGGKRVSNPGTGSKETETRVNDNALSLECKLKRPLDGSVAPFSHLPFSGIRAQGTLAHWGYCQVAEPGYAFSQSANLLSPPLWPRYPLNRREFYVSFFQGFYTH